MKSNHTVVVKDRSISEVFDQFSDSFLSGADGVNFLTKPESLRKNKNTVEDIWCTINLAIGSCTFLLLKGKQSELLMAFSRTLGMLTFTSNEENGVTFVLSLLSQLCFSEN